MNKELIKQKTLLLMIVSLLLVIVSSLGVFAADNEYVLNMTFDNTTYESLQIYNYTSHKMQYCDATNWVEI